jgi:hypothetical protein
MNDERRRETDAVFRPSFLVIRLDGGDVSIDVPARLPSVGALRYDRELKLGNEIERNIIERRVALVIGDS